MVGVGPQVWIEKDALIGVISKICAQYDVPYFSCRGYTSQSAMWQAGHKRFRGNQVSLIIHLGDHDPSGIDMTRDINDRLKMFAGQENVLIRRIALNMNQIEEFNPPPNPAKTTDSRAETYISKFGHDSWELDALEPRVIVDLIQETIEKVIEPNAWNEIEQRILGHQETLNSIADKYEDVRRFVIKE